MKLKNKVAVVTGSSRGIGRAIALKFAQYGAKVIVTYNNDYESGKNVVDEIQKQGAEAVLIKLDISKLGEVVSAVNEIVSRFGKIDILVNNAAMLQQKPFEEITEEEWDRMFDVNMKGPALCSQKVIPYMKKQNYGRIINISSIGGQWGGNLAVHYSATKAGIISLTRSLARIYSKDGINTNCISPGLVLTEMSAAEMNTEAGKQKLASIPIGRAAETEEIAEIAAFLASDEASYITGQVINANGGMLFNT